MRCAVGVALHSDGRHRNDRAFRKPLLQVFVFRLSLDEPLSPAIIVRASIPHDSVAGHIVQIMTRNGAKLLCRACDLSEPKSRSVDATSSQIAFG